MFLVSPLFFIVLPTTLFLVPLRSECATSQDVQRQGNPAHTFLHAYPRHCSSHRRTRTEIPKSSPSALPPRHPCPRLRLAWIHGRCKLKKAHHSRSSVVKILPLFSGPNSFPWLLRGLCLPGFLGPGTGNPFTQQAYHYASRSRRPHQTCSHLGSQSPLPYEFVQDGCELGLRLGLPFAAASCLPRVQCGLPTLPPCTTLRRRLIFGNNSPTTGCDNKRENPMNPACLTETKTQTHKHKKKQKKTQN